MKIRSLIIDDEKSNIDNLTSLLNKYCPNIEIVGCAEDGIAGMDLIKHFQPGLVFLDIEMPLCNGFQMLEGLQEIDFEIIFITAYNQYAIKAIKFCALDYLLKPVDILELRNAIEKVEKRITQKEINEKMKVFFQNSKEDQSNKKIGVPTTEKIEFIPIETIVRCKAENNYTEFIVEGRKKVLVSKTLKEYDELLSEYGFIRVHQSHLVNFRHIKSYIKTDGGYLLMSDDVQVSIARQKKDIVLKEIHKLTGIK